MNPYRSLAIGPTTLVVRRAGADPHDPRPRWRADLEGVWRCPTFRPAFGPGETFGALDSVTRAFLSYLAAGPDRPPHVVAWATEHAADLQEADERVAKWMRDLPISRGRPKSLRAGLPIPEPTEG